MSVEILLLGEIVPVRSAHRPDESFTLHAKGSGALARFYNVGLVVADSYATRNSLRACHAECWSYCRHHRENRHQKQVQASPPTRYPLTEAATPRQCLACPAGASFRCWESSGRECETSESP